MIQPHDIIANVTILDRITDKDKITPTVMIGEDIVNCEINTKLFNELYRPIPLTEKILMEWCKYVVSNPYQDRYEIGNIHIQYNGFTDTLWIDGMPHITCLHQLQRLVQSLTNQPLKITLK